MPQMAPMLWCLLFLYFVLSLSMVMSSVFFSALLKEQPMSSTSGADKMSWKW